MEWDWGEMGQDGMAAALPGSRRKHAWNVFKVWELAPPRLRH